MRWLLSLFGIRPRRRVSTKLTPRYEARRVRELRKAAAMFGEASHG